jgi:hypothetical protein
MPEVFCTPCRTIVEYILECHPSLRSRLEARILVLQYLKPGDGRQLCNGTSRSHLTHLLNFVCWFTWDRQLGLEEPVTRTLCAPLLNHIKLISTSSSTSSAALQLDLE